jgi:hypothetical protein
MHQARELDFCKLGKNLKMIAVWEWDRIFLAARGGRLATPEFGGPSAPPSEHRQGSLHIPLPWLQALSFQTTSKRFRKPLTQNLSAAT